MGFLNGLRKTSAAGEVSPDGAKRLIVKKPKLKFNPKAGQKELETYVLLRANHIPDSGNAVGQPSEFSWNYDPKFDLKFSDKIKRDWGAWYLNENDEWVYDHGLEERAGHFEKWAKDPEKKPVILVTGSDGKLHVWDGHHRIGMAHLMKMKTIPALVGKRKKK